MAEPESAQEELVEQEQCGRAGCQPLPCVAQLPLWVCIHHLCTWERAPACNSLDQVCHRPTSHPMVQANARKSPRDRRQGRMCWGGHERVAGTLSLSPWVQRGPHAHTRCLGPAGAGGRVCSFVVQPVYAQTAPWMGCASMPVFACDESEPVRGRARGHTGGHLWSRDIARPLDFQESLDPFSLDARPHRFSAMLWASDRLLLCTVLLRGL